jgi:phosphoribosylglycinamide formyltransferase-1
MPSGDKSRIAILASGTGSNADKICTYFHDHPHIRVNLIITNRVEAGVLQVAARHNIKSVYIPKKNWADSANVLPVLKTSKITHIILAGFLLLLPDYLIHAFDGRILNIHPALLPRHGGKGMFGHHVHESVKSSGEIVSGITIHEVNERFDEGRIVFQKEVSLSREDTAEDIAQKVLQLEHRYFPKVIEEWIRG